MKPKMRGTETGCGKVVTIIGAVVSIVCAVLLLLFITRIFGLWPDWAMEAELLFREAWKAWGR